MKVFETIEEMFTELRKAKIVSLAEWKYMRGATNWKPDFDAFVAKLRGGTEKELKKSRLNADRKAANLKVLKDYGLKQTTRKDFE